jgi:hypothetical protein
MFVSRLNAPSKQSCLQNSPCPPNLFCARTFILPHEIKLVVLDAVNNKVNTKNEGVKFGSYARINARRNANNIFTNPYNPNCCKPEVNIPLKPKSPGIVSTKRIKWPS